MRSEGPLDDTAFYRLVACAAPPDQPCAKPFIRWGKSVVTVGLVTRDPAYLGGKLKRAEASVERAIQRLNATGMAVQLNASDDTPDIAIHLLDTPRGAQMQGTGTPLDGLTLANALTRLTVRAGTIERAHIAFSNTMTRRQYESVMLEEIMQALGLITDIENPYYRSRSILSQNADNRLKRLGEQDIMALRRHYPPA
ncbi:DUF2927 domain-containing protein [Sulfitobacter albidus]|uniref:DUF2927 domain-containing protein n=1 Tax=Sulfitobacter albidus TaxID=2829501 RepID=A0A975PL42_9RHOB|nr:DUF2927 domain-containing protein [Sulfitobacter albidus]QUJ75289.1 DUF2927 domain-containing protein [Sulfitobacter albidus]